MIAILTLTLLAALPAPPPQVAPRARESAPPGEVVLYDVRDIALVSRDPALADARSDPEGLRRTSELLARLIRVFGPLGEGEASFAIEREAGATLGVFGTAATHGWVREWLALQRSGVMVDVQARFLELEPGHLESLGIEVARSVPLGAEDRDRLLASLGGGRGELISSPRIRTLSSSKAHIAVYDPISYVKDWRLEIVEPGSVEIADPEVATIEEGLRFEVLGTLLPDGSIGLELSTSLTSIRRPIRTAEVLLKGSSEHRVQVSLPDVETRSVQSTLVFSDGATVLLGAIPNPAGREECFLVTAGIVHPRIEGEGEGEPRSAPGGERGQDVRDR